MSWKKQIEGYLVFSRKDRIGFLALATLILLVYLLPSLMERKQAALVPVTDTVLLAALDSLTLKEEKYGREPSWSSREEEKTPRASVVFPFDPNTLDSAGWIKLGLAPRNVRTIMNYRAKGGRFRQRADLQRIWGLPAGFYERVENHITIEKKEEQPGGAFAYRGDPAKRKEILQVNTVDSAALTELPGIGPKLSARIISFRERLGGFYSDGQLAEVYGLPDSTFQKIRKMIAVDSNAIRRININTATKEQLKDHPYIRWNLANAIVEYRNRHGAYRSVEDLKNIVLLDDSSFRKLAPYLTF